MSEAEVKALLTAAGLEPIGCYPTLIEGIWEAVYDVGTVPTDEKFEAAGFSLPGIAQDITEFGETVTVIRFRLPDATGAPAPRYYVEKADGHSKWHVKDNEELDRWSKPVIIKTFWRLQMAESLVDNLNAANAPIEAPQHPVLAALKALHVDAMSPMEALTKLGELQRMLGQE